MLTARSRALHDPERPDLTVVLSAAKDLIALAI
jgi:hypothetical protein